MHMIDPLLLMLRLRLRLRLMSLTRAVDSAWGLLLAQSITHGHPGRIKGRLIEQASFSVQRDESRQLQPLAAAGIHLRSAVRQLGRWSHDHAALIHTRQVEQISAATADQHICREHKHGGRGIE